jgi:hypothetical protein
MEILKFDDEKSPTPRKRSGRGAILVAFVAVALGAGTALASGTLTINTDNKIALDQGVASTVQCDTDGITVSLGTDYDIGSSDFVLSSVSISDIDVTSATNCSGKYLTIKIYDESGTKRVFCTNPGEVFPDVGCLDDGKLAKLQVTGDSLTYNFTKKLVTGTVGNINVKNVTVESSNS